MTDIEIRRLLMQWQFWALELQFAGVVVTTLYEARHLRVKRSTLSAAIILGVVGWLLSSTVPPRTSRIYYDEQIYQDVGRNLSDLHRAQMCNNGIVEYGRLQCWQGEYNKEPYGYPYLLSVVYRVAGVSDTAAYRFNNAVAGLAVLCTVILADLLFQDIWIAGLSGLVLALYPMQIMWSNTAAAEPSAALFAAASALAAVHFARVRTTSALAWTVALSAFAMTVRPECVLVVPVVGLAILLFAPAEFRQRRLWLAGMAGLAIGSVTLLHMIAVRHDGWGATGRSMAWQFASANLPTNFWFYFRDERFPALCGIAAVIGLVANGRLRERVFLLAYFLAFWTVFVFFYAGSYNYGADVRYSLMSYVPLAVLGGVGLRRVGGHVSARWPGRLSDRSVYAAIAAAVVVQFLWYLPLVRATGEEAWGARADMVYARAFARRLPRNSLVLTHNPTMFHIWDVNAAQLSMVRTDPDHIEQLFARYAGGIYLHWNFWCNVGDRVQVAFCRSALDIFPHELVESSRERDYEYAFYRLRPREIPATPNSP